MERFVASASVVGLVFGVLCGPASASDAPRPPAELYKTYCSTCHEGGVPRAPHSVKFQMFGPAYILGALESGVMRTQGSALSADERRSLAEFLGGATLPTSRTVVLKRCEAGRSAFDFKRPPALAGWSMTLDGSRSVDARTAGLPADDVKRLDLKWAFAFPGATRARSAARPVGGPAR